MNNNETTKKFPDESVNIHCHFMNLSHLPNNYTRKITWKLVSENLLVLISNILPNSQLKKFLNAMKTDYFWGKGGTVDNYIRHGEYIRKSDLQTDKKNVYRFDRFAPLMMDMITASNIINQNQDNDGFVDAIANKDGVIPFIIQVHEYSYFAAQYPNKVFPFVMFNPIRPNSLKICQYAVDYLGFVGVKMYPAMGFNPDYESEDNKKKWVKENYINVQLENFYKWAHEAKIPITVHTQLTSLQRIDLTYKETAHFTDMDNWEKLLEKSGDFSFRINFAHFGGYGCFFEKPGSVKYEYSKKWRNQILGLMKKYNGNDVRIFTDVAAHDLKKLNAKPKEKYKDELNDNLGGCPGKAIMFGTDTPAISFAVTDQEYIDEFVRITDPKHSESFYSQNALNFLFGPEREPPKKYNDYLQDIENRICLEKSENNRYLFSI